VYPTNIPAAAPYISNNTITFTAGATNPITQAEVDEFRSLLSEARHQRDRQRGLATPQEIWRLLTAIAEALDIEI
jgi:hypothetical protein